MRKSLSLAALAMVVFVGPARAQFCPGASGWVFDDVSASDMFCSYITWAAQNGVTQGCLVIDANHRLFCPNDSVARSQVAAFVCAFRFETPSAFESVMRCCALIQLVVRHAQPDVCEREMRVEA